MYIVVFHCDLNLHFPNDFLRLNDIQGVFPRACLDCANILGQVCDW